MGIRAFITAVLLSLAACGGSREAAPPAASGETATTTTPPGGNPGQGTLNGRVTFVGTPCPQSSGPPCDGPYPNYEVVVFAADGVTEVARTRTGPEGIFDLALNEGDYVIYTQAGPSPSNRARTAVHVGRDALAQVTLRVDTGVR